MKWYRALIYELAETGIDETRNPIFELKPTDKTILVRSAPKSAARNDIEGNRFDLMSRTFLTKAGESALENAAAIEVCGELYEIDSVAAYDAPLAMKVHHVLKET